MSHGTFYRYFDSKRDVLDHLVDYGAARVRAVLEAHAPASTATLEECRRQTELIVAELVRLVTDEPRIARLLLFEATGVDEAMTERVYALLDELRAATAAYLRHGVSAGFLAAALDVEETARAVNGLAFAGALHSLREEPASRPDPARFVQAAVRLMFDGMSKA
jgi:AcrR family transcriptional regulator